MTYGVIARTMVLDRMVRQYLENHENTVVVNIACGLDTRCYRMKGNICAGTMWICLRLSKDKRAVSSGNRSDLSDCKVCNG